MKNELLSKFFRYALPGMFGMLGISCYILADTFFISLGMGMNGVAALNLAMPSYSLVHGLGLLLGMGGAIRFSVLKSRGDGQGASAVFTAVCLIGAGIAAVLITVAALFSRQIVTFLGAEGEVLEMADTYLRMLLFFSPAFLLNDILVCFVRSDGAPKLSMTSVLAGSLSNVLLDYIFIFPCGWGMFGAILATGLAPCIGVCVSSLHFLRRRNSFGFTNGRFLRYAAPCFALGLPFLAEQISTGAVIVAFNFILLRLAGNPGVAAYGVVANLSLVVISLFTGLAQGVQPLFSRAHGEEDAETSRRLLVCAAAFALALAIAVAAAVAACASPIARIFNSEGDALMQSIAVPGLRLYFIAAPFAGFNIVLCSFFAAGERALPAQLLTFLRGFLLLLPAAFAFSALWGVTGAWLSFPAAEFLTAALGAALLFAHRKNKKGGRGQAIGPAAGKPDVKDISAAGEL